MDIKHPVGMKHYERASLKQMAQPKGGFKGELWGTVQQQRKRRSRRWGSCLSELLGRHVTMGHWVSQVGKILERQ